MRNSILEFVITKTSNGGSQYILYRKPGGKIGNRDPKNLVSVNGLSLKVCENNYIYQHILKQYPDN